MDYTRVAPRFRRLACAFQVALVLALILYAAFQVGSIVTYSENPPVNTEMLPWNGAGRWAMCSWGTEHFGLTLSHVGMSIANHTGISMPDGSHRDNFSLMTSWTLSATRLELHGEMRNCSIVDLDNWEWERTPTFFFLCVRQYYQLYIWSADEWLPVWHYSAASYTRFDLGKTRHGWNEGFRKRMQDIYTVSYRIHFSSWIVDEFSACGWTNLTSDPPGRIAVVEVRIMNPLIAQTTVQGALPQLWTLFANIGGYVTLLSLVFTTVFVKANPNSEISRVYDARTFIGERIGFALPNGQPDQLRDAE